MMGWFPFPWLLNIRTNGTEAAVHSLGGDARDKQGGFLLLGEADFWPMCLQALPEALEEFSYFQTYFYNNMA